MCFIDSDILITTCILILFLVLTNLNPTLRFDGYWVVTDFLGIINIHQRTKNIIGQFINSIKLKLNLNINLSKLNKKN